MEPANDNEWHPAPLIARDEKAWLELLWLLEQPLSPTGSLVELMRRPAPWE